MRFSPPHAARLALLCSVSLVAFLALATAAVAEIRSGSATDPEESSKPAGRDLLAVAASYDTVSGQLQATVTTAGPPTTPDTFLAVSFFTAGAGGECTEPLAALGSIYGQSEAAWAYQGATGSGTKAVTGNVTTLTAAAPNLAGQGFGCAIAELFETEGEKFGERVEYLIRPFPLLAPPPPPPPPPVIPKLAKLGLAAPAPLTLKRNRWKQVKVGIANEGTATATNVKLKISKARGVEIKPKSGRLKLKSIGAGETKTAKIMLKLGPQAKRTSTLSLSVSGSKGLKAKSKLVLKVKSKGRRGKGNGPEDGGSLAGRIFTRYDMTDTMHSAYLEGYAFIDDTWAYNDVPSGGLPNCTQVTGNSKNAGCVRYKYDPRSGSVKVGSLSGGKLTEDGFEIEGEEYEELTIPKPGTTYQVSQYFMGFSGLCGLITGCTTWRSDVVLTSSGEFVLTSSSTTTSGGGLVPFVAVGSYPPDEHGTYRIEGRGRIRLAFADGHVENKTIAVFRDKGGKPDPVNVGFILDDEYFTFAGSG